MKRVLVATLAFAAVAGLGPRASLAEPHERFAHVPPPRFEDRHWRFDGRFDHNHYYPVPGYRVSALPPGHLVVNFHGGRFFFHAGVWYRAAGSSFVVVRPPVGIVVPVLPPDYTTVWIAGAPYYYADDVYYAPAWGGYAVIAPPHAP